MSIRHFKFIDLTFVEIILQFRILFGAKFDMPVIVISSSPLFAIHVYYYQQILMAKHPC